MSDVLVVGGGVIGLSISYELAGQGAVVHVVDRSQLGREASWAGAGMLPPGNFAQATSPEAQLRSYSHKLWPAWVSQLQAETAIDPGYFVCGGLEVLQESNRDRFHSQIDQWSAEGQNCVLLEGSEVREHAPHLSANIHHACFRPEVAQVRNPRLLRALEQGCRNRGVQITTDSEVREFIIRDDKVQKVVTAGDQFSADQVCIASGAWSQRLLTSAGFQTDIHPVRGQMVLLSTKDRLFSEIIEVGLRYIVPRDDGRVLIGSTVENVGFDKQTTAEEIAQLIQFAIDLVPELSQAKVEQTWAGLRPGTKRDIPYLGSVEDLKNLFVAAGHFRSGLQMSAGTAKLISQCMRGEAPAIPLVPFQQPTSTFDLDYTEPIHSPQ